MHRYIKAKLVVKLTGLCWLIKGKNVIMGTDTVEPPFQSKRDTETFMGKMGWQRLGFVQNAELLPPGHRLNRSSKRTSNIQPCVLITPLH